MIKNRRIALLTPSYKAKSETWIWRQINYLKPNISFIGVQETTPFKEESNIPVINLLEIPGVKQRVINKLKKVEYNHQYLLNYNLNKVEKLYKINTYYIHYLTQAYKLKERLLNTNKDIFIHCHGYDVSWKMKSLTYPFDKIYNESYINFAKEIQKNATYIANSDFTKSNLLKIGIKKENIKVLKFGVEIPKNIPVKKNTSPFKILFLGRLVDCKGPHLTIQAFNKACDMGMNAELILAGDGPMMSTCRLLINQSPYADKIKLLGAVTYSEGQKLREKCHIFTTHNMTGELTGQVEAYGVSFVEALINKLPVVTGRSGGIPEIVKHKQVGYLFASGNVDEHAKYLYNLSNDRVLYSRISEEATIYAQKNFAINKEQNNLFNIL
ncbi:glycosyltransferase family 4 protein [Carboxylicivirga marina]|uniref:Glycosyltransferase family 4 protein n=1 Tax=Carboxylicivirga marina TaxID=2800988 RepID=A0ABS1HJD0_9BACT|nr:glycosyltransferase family 4 protein [Carboxylicivirga marina]MBK3517681.1 glycosyltransferase family 4 protein [Carboxylicivirga marina]